MKMWFPNKAQWVVMWIGLIIAGIVGLSIGEDAYQNIEGAIGVIFGVIWVVVATALVVWMIEGRRRKTEKND